MAMLNSLQYTQEMKVCVVPSLFGCGIWCPTHNHLNKMTLSMREWLKHIRDLILLLRYADSEDEHRGIDNNCNSVAGSQSCSCSSDNVPETPHSFVSDSVIGTLYSFDFRTVGRGRWPLTLSLVLLEVSSC
ncbi:hypothetical protein ATANTOWER_017565 [Ataeniobius toweri]|uniref:Uncharacterized protein n=1 Tax=Ataeniobius toweri TaxID=208326 RepID=A0ABU7CAE7_9TELE|nr:hypothetical protein [Ataeniobius toweri]